MNDQEVQITTIDIPAEFRKKHMIYIRRTPDGTGNVMARPLGGKKRTPAQNNAVDAAVKKVREAFVAKAKKLRDNHASAWQELKKDPMSDRLKNAFLKAKEEREAFDKERSAAELKAKAEARKKALS